MIPDSDQVVLNRPFKLANLLHPDEGIAVNAIDQVFDVIQRNAHEPVARKPAREVVGLGQAGQQLLALLRRLACVDALLAYVLFGVFSQSVENGWFLQKNVGDVDEVPGPLCRDRIGVMHHQDKGPILSDDA